MFSLEKFNEILRKLEILLYDKYFEWDDIQKGIILNALNRVTTEMLKGRKLYIKGVTKPTNNIKIDSDWFLIFRILKHNKTQVFFSGTTKKIMFFLFFILTKKVLNFEKKYNLFLNFGIQIIGFILFINKRFL